MLLTVVNGGILGTQGLVDTPCVSRGLIPPHDI